MMSMNPGTAEALAYPFGEPHIGVGTWLSTFRGKLSNLLAVRAGTQHKHCGRCAPTTVSDRSAGQASHLMLSHGGLPMHRCCLHVSQCHIAVMRAATDAALHVAKRQLYTPQPSSLSMSATPAACLCAVPLVVFLVPHHFLRLHLGLDRPGRHLQDHTKMSASHKLVAAGACGRVTCSMSSALQLAPHRL